MATITPCEARDQGGELVGLLGEAGYLCIGRLGGRHNHGDRVIRLGEAGYGSWNGSGVSGAPGSGGYPG